MKVVTAFCAAITGFVMLANASAFAAAGAAGSAIANNHPKFSSSAKMIGKVDQATPVEVTLWLTPHNKADMDSVAKDLYDPTSPNYRHWLSKAELVKRYAPTAAENKKVSDFLTANKMTIVKTGPDNFYVRAKGTAAAVSAAFHVTLNNYEVDGKTVRANVEDPTIEGEVAGLVNAVAGLDSLEYTHPMVTKLSGPKTPSAPASASQGASLAKATTAASSAAGTSLAFNFHCFNGETTQTFTSSGTLPEATYTGNAYNSNAAGCGYTPYNIWKAYGLNALYAEGFNGAGQTIVILDWCGSPTIESDANVFSEQFGLPKLTSKNFQITYTPSPSFCAAPDAEINLDVEWAHAIAPGAAINLVVPPSASFQDINEGLFYAVDYQLGNVISNSYGSEELYTPESTMITGDLINEMAALTGISVNYSSGDSGDFTFDYPLGSPASVSFPANSPWATAVGGTSLVLTIDGAIDSQLGWGNNENLLSESGFVEEYPSDSGGFYAGSGGGASEFFAKPSYQKHLPGPARQVPDISWLADPFTGAYIAISEPFTIPELQYEAIGGTSLACPMFSALWAIANQEAGQPLGQAAPYVYSMPSSTITDILPISSKSNVTGVVELSSGKTKYTAAQLASPIENSPNFISVLWDYPLYQDTAELVTFGTDSGLTVTKGWDNVTGVGVPVPKAFADYFKP
jgi:subtilase family serine protease